MKNKIKDNINNKIKSKLIYTIGNCQNGIFVDRPNRFIVNVEIDKSILVCHLHDSGRIKELLYVPNKISILKAKNFENRKTMYDIISAFADDGEEILLNSSLHRYISENFLNDYEISPFGKIEKLRAEVKYGDSRIDYLLEKKIDNKTEKIWVEVKGVSLSQDKIAMFPDAPSERASRHLRELMKIKNNGDRAAVLLLIFRDSNYFRPRFETDKVFNKTFYEAINMGVEIYPVQFFLANGQIYYKEKKIEILEDINETDSCNSR
jgi:sugar fermentation stimulation protein A